MNIVGNTEYTRPSTRRKRGVEVYPPSEDEPMGSSSRLPSKEELRRANTPKENLSFGELFSDAMKHSHNNGRKVGGC